MLQLYRANVRPARPTIKMPCTDKSTTPHTEIFFSDPARPISTNAHAHQRLPSLVIYFNQSNYFFSQHTTTKERSTSTVFKANMENASKQSLTNLGRNTSQFWKSWSQSTNSKINATSLPRHHSENPSHTSTAP